MFGLCDVRGKPRRPYVVQNSVVGSTISTVLDFSCQQPLGALQQKAKLLLRGIWVQHRFGVAQHGHAGKLVLGDHVVVHAGVEPTCLYAVADHVQNRSHPCVQIPAHLPPRAQGGYRVLEIRGRDADKIVVRGIEQIVWVLHRGRRSARAHHCFGQTVRKHSVPFAAEPFQRSDGAFKIGCVHFLSNFPCVARTIRRRSSPGPYSLFSCMSRPMYQPTMRLVMPDSVAISWLVRPCARRRTTVFHFSRLGLGPKRLISAMKPFKIFTAKESEFLVKYFPPL